MKQFRVATLAIAVTLALLQPVPAGSDAARGDVNGDGRIDGADALMVLRHVKGLATLTEEQRARADVDPLPGTGGRIIGDGSILQADAEKLLRFTLGLVSRGEVTGAFEGPHITSFEPAMGGPGTRVTLRGVNFVSKSTTENVVEFCGAAAAVAEVTDAEIVAVVPEGAVTGPIRLRTPGGEASTGSAFIVPVHGSGHVSLPGGLDPKAFTAWSANGTSAIDAEGEFDLPLRGSSVELVAAVPKSGTARNVFLGMALPGQGRQVAAVQVNALTTAQALIFMQPCFLTDDPVHTRILLNTMAGVPAVAQLQQLITTKWPAGPAPLADPQVQVALAAAVAAVESALPASEKIDFTAVPTAVTPSRAAKPNLLHVDLSLLDPRVEENAVLVSNGLGCPMDWILHLAQVDPNDPDFDRGPGGAAQSAVFDRLRYITKATAPANSLSAQFISFDYLVAKVLNLVKPAPRLEIGPDRDAVYVLRAFSGALLDHSAGNADSALLDAMPGGHTLGLPDGVAEALLTNAIAGTMEYLYLLVDLKKILKDAKAGQELMFKLKDVFIKSFAYQFPHGAARLSAMEVVDRMRIVFLDLLKEALKILVRESLKAGAQWLAEGVVCDFLKDGLLPGVKHVAMGAQIGRMAERLSGVAGCALALREPITPLESALVVVGDPFGPKITGYPSSAFPADAFKITGTGFSPNPDRNQVYFEGRKAEMVSVNADGTELVVKTPSVPPDDDIEFTVVTRRGERTAGPITVYRVPTITGVSPGEGFADCTFLEQPFDGTDVRITGTQFDPEGDKVTFAGGALARVLPGSTDAQLWVRVPYGARTGKLRVKTPQGRQVESPSDFELLGVPRLTGASVPAAKAGERFYLFGLNLGNPAQARFRYGSITSTQSVTVAEGAAQVQVYMPSEIPEGKDAIVNVLTPGGTSTAVIVRRLPGSVAGCTVTAQPSATIAPDGILSFAEGLEFIQGKRNPFSVADKWDDADLDAVMYEMRYYKKESNGSLTLTRTEYLVGSVRARSTFGHTSTEWAYVTLIVKEYVNGRLTKTTTNPVSTTTLDSPSVTNIHGKTNFPGIGKREEGDAFDRDVGSSLADELRVDCAGQELAMAISLDAPSAGGDTIRISNASAVRGNVLVATDRNEVAISSTLKGRFEITGNSNRASLGVGTQAGAIVEGGIALAQGHGNQVTVRQIGRDEVRTSKGVAISGGAHDNTVTVTGSIRNCTVGVEILDRAKRNTLTGGSVVTCGTGAAISGAETVGNTLEMNFGWLPGNPVVQMPCLVGAHVFAGAKENRLGYVRYSTADGVWIEGAGTEANVVRGSSNNEGNGVTIARGACRNIVDARTASIGIKDDYVGNRKLGVYIRDQGTNGNIVRAGIAGNTLGGAAVVGSATDQPAGNVFDGATFGENGGADLLLRGLQGQPPTVEVKNCVFLSAAATRVPAILLDQTSGARLEYNLIGARSTYDASDPETGHSVGILMQGRNTKNNTSLLDIAERCGTAGFRITGGASDNRVVGPFAFSNGQYGILVDGAAADTVIEVDPSRTRRLSGQTGSSGGIISGNPTGVGVAGGARNTNLDGLDCRPGNPHAPAVVIQGPATTKTYVDGGSKGAIIEGLVVRDGATETFLRGLTVYCRADVSGIEVIGAATRKVTIQGTQVQAPYGMVVAGARGGIVVDGAAAVAIGVGAAGGNRLRPPDPGAIRIIGGKNVTLTANDIDGAYPRAGSGILVEGGSNHVIVQGNTVKDYLTYGMRVSASEDVWIQRNKVTGSRVISTSVPSTERAEPIEQVGIRVDGGAKKVHAESNEFQLNLQDGVQISGQGTSANEFLRNTITENGRHGIAILDAASGNTLGYNTVAANVGWGVSVAAGATGNCVQAGWLYKNGAGPIQSDAVPAPRVTEAGPGHVAGEVDAGVPVNSQVQVYADTGNQGKQYLGATRTHSADDSRAATGVWRLACSVPTGMNLAATVTTPQGTTSAFGTGLQSGTPAALSSRQGIVFCASRDGNREIYRREAGDPVDTRLTDDLAADHSPAASPDGTLIAFVSERSGNPDIWLVRPEGGWPGQRTDHRAPDYDPAWSPDGRKVLFTSERDGNPEIYLMDADGANVRRLTTSPGVDRYPSFSPDGTKIAFTSARAGNLDVWVMNADGTGPVRLTSHAAADYDPSWSPNGQRITFVSERDGNPEIYLMAPNGTGLTRLTRNAAADREPAFSPDGNWVAYSSAVGGDAEVFAVAVEGGRVQRLTVSLGANTQPGWIAGQAGGSVAVARRGLPIR